MPVLYQREPWEIYRQIFRTKKALERKSQTSARSTRIPFGLFLNVGGNKENIAKKAVSPAAFLPSRVTWKVLFVSVADAVGLSCAENCFQVVAVFACALIELEASTFPLLDTSEAVSFPLKVEFGENLKKKEAS